MKLNKTWGIVGGVAGVFLIIIFSLIGSYNGLVTRQADVDKAVADLEVQLQRRFDLIPNLVGAVKGAMSQEREVFDSIAEARTRYAGAKNSSDRLEAAADVEQSLGRLLVVVENYPQLASLQNVRDLQVDLAGTENRVAQARRLYNETATSYNVAIRRFPRSIIAGMFGFERYDLFESDKGAENAPEVDLTPGN
jgi:LemA protein